MLPSAQGPGGRNPISLGARWITSAEHHEHGLTSLPALARRFSVRAGSGGATLHLACLGVLVVTLDGKPVSPDVLEPGYCEWRRFGEYVSWEIPAARLSPGEHILRVELGGGMYRSAPTDERWNKITTEVGDIAVALSLDVRAADGSVERLVSDESWRGTRSATLVANWTGGETYDARLERDDLDDWPAAVLATVPPDLTLVAKRTPPLRVVESLSARSICRRGDAWIVDFGTNTAGWPVVDLPPGATVRLRPAELLEESGAVDVRTEGWGPVFHDVRTGDEPVTWHPRMTYNGLRYLEVTGLDPSIWLGSDDVRMDVVHADVPEASGFDSGDERLDAIWRIVRRAIASNMMSVFTDCPHREKLGYLEQIHALHDLLVRAYASGPILDWMLDLAIDAQRSDGSMGLFVPEWEEFPDPWRGDPNWGGALVFLALARHRATGETVAIDRALPAIRRYLTFLLDERGPDGLLSYGLGDFNGKSIEHFRDVELVATATLHKLLRHAAQAADLVGAPDGAAWRAAAQDVAASFARAFVHEDGSVGPRTLTAHVVALDAGLAPDSLIDLIEDQVVSGGYVLDVGAVVMALLVDHLAAAGRHETLFAITRVTDEPSYGYMLAHGATSLTECWDGPTFGFSQNHFMFGAIGTWFHEYVVGIRQVPGSAGWTSPLIAPVDVPEIDGATGWFDAPTGRIEVSWRREGGAFVVEGSAPHGVGATVRLPSGAETTVRGPFRLVDEG